MTLSTMRRQWRVPEYHRMVDAGILDEDDRVELLDGEIIEMSPIGSRHVACVIQLTALLSAALTGSALVSVQNPIWLDDASEPQPDLALLQPRLGGYAHSLPAASDVLLLIEVADTSLQTDQNDKLPLYARADIAEVWIVDLVHEQVLVYSDPGNGRYQRMQKSGRGGSVTSGILPALRLAVDAILA